MNHPQMAENRREPQVSPEAWWTLAVLCLFYVLSYLDRYLLTMLVDPIQKDLGIGDFEMGLVLGPAFGIALGVAALPFGWMVDRSPRRKVLFFGVAFWSFATAATGFARSTLGLGLARLGVGAGEAALGPAAASLLADKFPRRRLTTALAIFQASNKLGSATAFGVGGLLIGMLGGAALSIPLIGSVRPWQIAFFCVGTPGILAAFLVYTFSEPVRRGRKSTEPPRPGALLAFLKEHRTLMLLIYGGFTLIALCGYSLVAWVPTFVSRRYGLEPQVYGPLLSVVSIVAAGALVIKGTIVDWLYARGHKDANILFYSWIVFGSTPLAVIAFFVPGPWIFFGIYGVLLAVSIPSMLYLAASLATLAPNELRGQLTALAYALHGILGLGLGPTIVGAITDFGFQDPNKIGWSLALVCGVGMPAGAILLRFAMKPMRIAVGEVEAIEQARG
ncbi:MAG: permease of the major facilitator superfamily [Sphingomonas bacterium]|uniref:MFS transporter n=1 Tax=Sphingomonas bacterium TaxID=1895847 RepID=UPI0026265404|nr:MFS transporter [Sphingomonas bacterium]MDB5695034.1 permease of the major facilitator superfamily [Sphingomonas bacterium]